MRVGWNRERSHAMAVSEIAYLSLRLALCALVAIAAWRAGRVAWAARRAHLRWYVAAAGGALLLVASALSGYDAIDNLVLRPADPILPTSWLWLFSFDLIVPIWSFLLIAAWRERDLALAELSLLSVTDQLTGSLNRRGFVDRASVSIAQARRSGLHSALIMFDIDHFKAVNDGHGHAAGDMVLREVVSVLLSAMRPGDFLGRIGGEEFAVFLHDGTSATAFSIADRLRVQVRNNVKHPAGGGRSVTVSGGVAPVPAGLEPEAALSIALSAADEALYAAKRDGRDRIVAIPMPVNPVTEPGAGALEYAEARQMPVDQCLVAPSDTQ
jgi:diguanylate cyclase (GGDEF)-like protein